MFQDLLLDFSTKKPPPENPEAETETDSENPTEEASIGQPTEPSTPEVSAPISQPIGQPAPAPAPAPQADPAVEQVVAVLRSKGVPDKTIADAIHAVQNGVPAEQVANQIERLIGNGR